MPERKTMPLQQQSKALTRIHSWTKCQQLRNSSASMTCRFNHYDVCCSISFTNGYKFVLLTSKPRRIKPPAIPLWELSTPYGKAIFVQRNGYVDIVPEDVPLETLLAEGHLRG